MTFKLGYCTLRWKEPDLEPALERLAEVGWDGWEARLPLDWMGTPARVRRICENTGMPMAVYTASGSPDHRDSAHVERNKRRMEFAAEVGADCFMFMNQSRQEGQIVSNEDIRFAAEGAEAWAEYAAQFGLELSYHIHTNMLVDSIEEWRTYMGYLDQAKLCIDVSHAQLWGYDPVESLRDFRDQLNYVHLQDYAAYTRHPNGFHDPQWVDVGEAENVDFVGVRKVLEEIGYARWVTGCPGQLKPGLDDPMSMAKQSRGMLDYLRGIGY